jgi:hypothetical protein
MNTNSDNIFRTGLILLGVGFITTVSIFFLYPETFENQQPPRLEDELEEGSSEGSSHNELIDHLNTQTTENPNELEVAKSPPPELRIDVHEFDCEPEPEANSTSTPTLPEELSQSLSTLVDGVSPSIV